MELKDSDQPIKNKCIKLVPLLHLARLFDYRGFNLWFKSIEQFANHFGCLQFICSNFNPSIYQNDFFQERFNFIKCILILTTEPYLHAYFKNLKSIKEMVSTIHSKIIQQVPSNYTRRELTNFNIDTTKFNEWKWNADEANLFLSQLIKFGTFEIARGNYFLKFSKEYRDLFLFDFKRITLIVDYHKSSNYFQKYYQVLLSEFVKPVNNVINTDINSDINNNIKISNLKINSNSVQNSPTSPTIDLTSSNSNANITSNLISNSCAELINQSNTNTSNLISNLCTGLINQTTNASDLIKSNLSTDSPIYIEKNFNESQKSNQQLCNSLSKPFFLLNLNADKLNKKNSSYSKSSQSINYKLKPITEIKPKMTSTFTKKLIVEKRELNKRKRENVDPFNDSVQEENLSMYETQLKKLKLNE